MQVDRVYHADADTLRRSGLRCQQCYQWLAGAPVAKRAPGVNLQQQQRATGQAIRGHCAACCAEPCGLRAFLGCICVSLHVSYSSMIENAYSVILCERIHTCSVFARLLVAARHRTVASGQGAQVPGVPHLMRATGWLAARQNGQCCAMGCIAYTYLIV
jgi:hypothetical protein